MEEVFDNVTRKLQYQPNTKSPVADEAIWNYKGRQFRDTNKKGKEKTMQSMLTR